MLTLVTAMLSALLDNVTTVLLIAPVTLLITDELDVKPYPYLFAEIFASNIGGTATLIGDPPNIMIGSAVGLTFNDFLLNLGPIVAVLLPAMLLPIYLIWGRGLKTSPKNRQHVMNFQEADAITDKRLLKQSLFVLALVITGFILSHNLGQEPATIAMFGAAMLLLLSNLPRSASEQTEAIDGIFAEVEWITIFFFIGLFIIVYAVETTGLLSMLAHEVLAVTKGDPHNTTLLILWVSAIASAVVDNIPFVATMIPLIKNMAPSLGGHDALMPLWWALALGSCLGGNGSLIGASANLIVAGFAERSGHPIRFMPFLVVAFPLMLTSIAICTVYIYLRYL
jgi:Na+/H+ antiporter NhaD/arsenite permease-like protein